MPAIVSPEQFFEKMSGTLSARHQISGKFIDLTVNGLYRIRSSGQLDFGGSEFSAGTTEPCSPVKIDPEDSYGWWNLHEGYYRVVYNETFQLPGHEIALLQPHPRLLQGGSFHPTMMISELNSNFQMLLQVPKHGIQLKENARISQLVVFTFQL